MLYVITGKAIENSTRFVILILTLNETYSKMF